jgi:predicted O-methyltransferase YrrM
MQQQTQYLDPTTIIPLYTDRGPYMIDFAHLAQIVPGFKRPEPELLGEILGMRKKSTADIPRLEHCFSEEERGRLEAAIEANSPEGDDPYFGMMDPVETWTMIGIIQAMEPKTIFEIGTGKGIVTKYFADATPDNARVYTLDVLPSDLRSGNTRWKVNRWNNNYVKHQDKDIGSAYKGTPAGEKIEQLIGDVGTFDFSPYYEKMDIVLVDADHDFEAQTHALREAFKLVSPGGLIAVDDYGRMHHLQGPMWSVQTTAMGEPKLLNALGFPQGSKAWYYLADSKPFDKPDSSNLVNAVSTGLILHPNVQKATRNYRNWVSEGTDL